MMRVYHGGWGYGGFMGPSFLCMVIGIIVLIDLALLGVWLWQRIKREELESRAHHHSHPHHHTETK